MKQHKHVWKRTTKLVRRGRDSNWIERFFEPYYRANVAKCECGEWHYIIK